MGAPVTGLALHSTAVHQHPRVHKSTLIRALVESSLVDLEILKNIEFYLALRAIGKLRFCRTTASLEISGECVCVWGSHLIPKNRSE